METQPLDPKIAMMYEKLKKVRVQKDLVLTKSKYLRDTFIDFGGREKPLKLRYYQVQGILHLMGMKRFLLADDCGLGKSLSSIGCLCHLWEKNPNLKVLVLTTKSAAPQWVDEFKRFTTGINLVLCRGTAAQRASARETFNKLTGPTVMVMGYRSAVQDFTDLQNLDGIVFIADECLDYFTPVQLADGTTELIGKIVSKRMPVEVLSENPQTGLIEAKRVVNWHQIPMFRGTHKKSLQKISFRFSKSIRVTLDHNVYLPDGTTRPVSQLKVGHEVVHLCANIPSDVQKQVVFGGLMGDASISFPTRNFNGIVFVQSSKQGEYLRFKRNLLEPLGVSEIDSSTAGYQPASGMKSPVERFRLNGNAFITSTLVQGRVWRDGKKHITKEWLDQIGPLGLAIWYADDGSIQTHVCKDGQITHSITLHTEGFSRDEQEMVAGWLQWKWGIQAEIKTNKPKLNKSTGQARSYSYIYLPAKEVTKFLGILPGSMPGVEYKFPGLPPFQWSPDDVIPSTGPVVDWVTSKERFTHQNPNIRYVYDIEVEDNHNYFAGGGVKVSNCTAFKNPRTQVAQVCRHLSLHASRAYGLSATPLKNNLTETYGIYSVIVPGLFSSMAQFMKHYCIVEYQRLPRSNRKIPIIVGHSDYHIELFKEKIDPYFLGRPKHEVAPELPPLTIKNVTVDLYPEQEAKYKEALSGLLEVSTSEGLEEKEVSKLTAVTYCQEIVNHLGLIGQEGGSSKLDALVEMLTDGDLAGEKVIVFTRFRKMVDIAIPVLEKEGVKCTRVTGTENDLQRRDAMNLFQKADSGTNVIFITMAGGDAINLQAAKAIIFYDSPWSAGDLIQILGRMIRIGSDHDKVYAFNLVAESGKVGQKITIDGRVQQVLAGKMNLIEAVIGKRVKGEKGDAVDYRIDGDVNELFKLLKDDGRQNQDRVS